MQSRHTVRRLAVGPIAVAAALATTGLFAPVARAVTPKWTEWEQARSPGSDHDDLVLAAAMAAWLGEKRLWSILKLPPMPRAPVETRQPTFDELIKLQPQNDPDGRRPRI